MGNRFMWDKRYNVGVDIIDKEHQKLFSILNKLFDFGRREEKSHFACQEAIKYFREHAIQHFADEEAYMVSINYPGLETHKRIHKDFRERMLPALENELELTGYSRTSIHHFLGVCAGWLIGHTLIEDHMIVSGEPIRHWEKLLPEEDQTVMGQTIASLLHGMFRLDSQLISNYYAGEKFGHGFYCHLIYSNRDKKKWEFFLLFEAQLIGSTIGNIIDTKSETTDMMLSNVARYAAKQLVERVKRHFSALAQYEMTEEQLLTYEQFYKMYEKQSPQFSLLFDTGRGYFAYCMTSSESPRRKDGISAVTENAMTEIENYMRHSKTSVEAEDQLCVNRSVKQPKDQLHVNSFAEQPRDYLHVNNFVEQPRDYLHVNNFVEPKDQPRVSFVEPKDQPRVNNSVEPKDQPRVNSFVEQPRNYLPVNNSMEPKEQLHVNSFVEQPIDYLHVNSSMKPIDHLRVNNFVEQPRNYLPVNSSVEHIDHLHVNSSMEPIDHLHINSFVEPTGNRKKKILVVDDSDFMRKSMLDLLGNDYEVLTVGSGMSAIRSISLTRPDLVLLDYEMPVCNGSQVLEMIRSEKDFTDIPVIFLTCRVDSESVKKAISLKPDGYLSKFLPAESVKKAIDHFFEKRRPGSSE